MNETWLDELRMAWLVARRELHDQFRDWRVIVPMVFLTLFFPFLMNATAKAALDFAAQYGTPLVAERLVPFFMMVVGFFPITVSLVIALESFVGEKERGTIEPLLSSPLKDWQLYLGKLVAASTVPIMTAYLGIGVYLISLSIRRIPFPDPNILAQTVVLTSVQAVLMVSGAIVISTQATSVRAANLMSSFIVIPMALLIQGESILMFWGNNQVLWLAVLAVSILAGLLVRLGVSHFQREALLGREIDVLDFRWMWRMFWRSFVGGARTVGEWYRCVIGTALRRQRIARLSLVIIGMAAIVGGYTWLSGHAADLTSASQSPDFLNFLESGMGIPTFDRISVPSIFGNNVRATFFIFVLGIFSFGVLGVLAYIINLGLIGLVLAALPMMGIPPLLAALSGLLPHAIFELPALVLSSAAVLHLGAVLVTPNPQRTLGEVLIEAIADWTKITLGLVIPLLAIAAVIETYVSLPLLLATLGGL
ncbi:MAG: stage II sporulation protein M [Anaerolineales bacterium]